LSFRRVKQKINKDIIIAVPRCSSSSFLMGGSPSGSLSAWRLRGEESVEDSDGIDLAKQQDSFFLPPFKPTRKNPI
jgi:hypothetical protein